MLVNSPYKLEFYTSRKYKINSDLLRNENNEFIKIVKNKSVEIICEDKEPI